MSLPGTASRRRFLHHAAGLTAAGALPVIATPARGAGAGLRSLAFSHAHTRERIDLVYAFEQGYVATALASLNHFLRDHYSGEVGTIDPRMFDMLHRVQSMLGVQRAFEVISGYRCPATNLRLKQTRAGGVATRSLHMDGRAIDVRLPGVPLAELRDAALQLRAGGVGFYPREQFVHIDTGAVRRW